MQRRVRDRDAFYLASLDGIRAVAITGVFGLHLARQYFPGGAFGVDVFFVLSAYLITSILLRELRHRGRIRFGAFYCRRIFRLGPALVLWLLLLATPTALLQHAGSSISWSTAGALFYFNDFLEAWTRHVGSAYDQSWSLLPSRSSSTSSGRSSLLCSSPVFDHRASARRSRRWSRCRP